MKNRVRKHQNIVIATFALCTIGCTEWHIEVTTMSGDSAVTTVVTASMGDEAGNSETSGAPTTSSSDGDGTFGMSTSNTEPTTGETPPTIEPPTGCAFFVEINGGGTAENNFVMVDWSECERGQSLAMWALPTNGFPVRFDLDSSDPGCFVWGGPSSPAAMSTDGVTIDWPGPDMPTNYALDLLVDEVVSDRARVPIMLKGQSWPEAPACPTTPVHRVQDWSWSVVTEHIAGCDLITDDF